VRVQNIVRKKWRGPFHRQKEGEGRPTQVYQREKRKKGGKIFDQPQLQRKNDEVLKGEMSLGGSEEGEEGGYFLREGGGRANAAGEGGGIYLD